MQEIFFSVLDAFAFFMLFDIHESLIPKSERSAELTSTVPFAVTFDFTKNHYWIHYAHGTVCVLGKIAVAEAATKPMTDFVAGEPIYDGRGEFVGQVVSGSYSRFDPKAYVLTMIGPDGYQFDGEGESDWEFLTAEPYGYKRFGKDVTTPATRWFSFDRG